MDSFGVTCQANRSKGQVNVSVVNQMYLYVTVVKKQDVNVYRQMFQSNFSEAQPLCPCHGVHGVHGV